jgi:hypothetical protein
MGTSYFTGFMTKMLLPIALCGVVLVAQQVHYSWLRRRKMPIAADVPRRQSAKLKVYRAVVRIGARACVAFDRF